ncbi:hypothetical protein [Streptomyces sp. NPDC013455]|uniref:hypothetical protein n=1 Tax=Streptomyces sp. NPDC013455 TaxID=3155605 RepID=UPI00340E0A40
MFRTRARRDATARGSGGSHSAQGGPVRRRGSRTAASVGAVALAAAAAGLSAAGVAHADGHGEGYYGVWASGVNVRAGGGETCYLYPSVANCPTVEGTVGAPQSVWVYCQQEGAQVVGGNPYWVWVRTPSGARGYMAGYYISNVSNWIDGVPQC